MSLRGVNLLILHLWLIYAVVFNFVKKIPNMALSKTYIKINLHDRFECAFRILLVLLWTQNMFLSPFQRWVR